VEIFRQRHHVCLTCFATPEAGVTLEIRASQQPA